MADTFEKIIFKLELDDSSYTTGADKLAASTSRLTQVQEAANKALKILQEALDQQSKSFQKAKLDLENYTGSDEKHRQQLTKTFQGQKSDNEKLITLVAQARKEYEAATKAAQDFANISARANNLQTQPGQRIAPQPSVAAGLNAQIFNTIDLTDMAELAEITALTKTEFYELADSILLAEERLKQLDPASEEFKQLAPIVEQGNKALKDYQQATEQAAGSQTSLRSQIRLSREELVRLEQAGKANTKEYFELEKRVARLTDAFNDQQQRIKILASDTKLLDFGKGAITAATAAFQAYTAVSILVGDQNEELQKKTMQLFAAMQLLQSLEQLSNLTRREGVLATLAQSGAQAAYTAVVGATTGALRVLRIALAATGIGAAIVGIALLIQKISEIKEEMEEAGRRQRLMNDAINESAGEYQEAVKNVNLLRINIDLAKKGFIDKQIVVKQYNETIGKTTGEVNNLNEAEQALNKNAEAYIQFTLLKAAANIALQESSKAIFEAEKEEREQRDNIIKDVQSTEGVIPGFGIEASKEEQDRVAERSKNESDDRIDQSKKESKTLLDIAKDFQTRAAQISKDFKFNFGDPGKPDTKAVENEFAKRLRELQAKLAEVTAKSFESDGTIRKQFQLSLEKEIGSLNQLVKDQKLTAAQSEILIDLTTRINEVQLNEALAQFNKKVTDARNKLNEELRDLQQQNTEESIQLLQDEFERRKQLIDFNEKEELAQSEQNTADRLAALEEQRDLVGEQAYQDAKNRIVQAGEDEQTNIIIRASQQRQQLAIDSFKKIIDGFNDALFNTNLINDKAALEDIKALSAAFLTGKITYEKYKKDLAAIQKKYEDAELQNTIDNLEAEIRALNRKINNTLDLTEKQYDDLIKLVKQKEAELVAAKTQQAVVPPPDESDPGIQRFVDTANAIGAVADSVVQFWQAANDAEAAALDRSISLQERRVDAALRIAERGNAQYLKAEEDRLKELQVARENAARRQLGIDAALQASQLLVGITGAIAKIASGAGIVETIASIAVIVSALATGYGLVKSLQGNQPTFFVGTTDTGRGGKSDHKGGFIATLHPHEAVIPADKNKAYHPTVEAIYKGSIKPEVINNFVKTHHTIKSVPLPNYQRIKEAAETSVSHDGRMAVVMSEQNKLIVENNDLQRQVLRALKTNKIDVHYDADGLAVHQMQFIDQIQKDKKL